MAESLHICFYGPFTHLPFWCCAMYFDLKVHAKFAARFQSIQNQAPPVTQDVDCQRRFLGASQGWGRTSDEFGLESIQLGGGFKYFLFSPLPGEIQFDQYFSKGLKPPTRQYMRIFILVD